ncbi:hypothetical protein ACVVIH_20475 [Chryseobacterium arthrosphaerae]
MKVTLLKRVGDNPEGKELEITDESVLHAWVELGVIENPFTDIDTSENYSNYKLDELKALAEEKELPREEWDKLKKEDLINYITEKLK